jgi:aminoglycoside phosphotransferase (APT) family kinase protein
MGEQRGADSPAPGAPLSREELASRLAEFVAGSAGAPREAVRIEGLRPLAGGASRELWALDLELACGRGAPDRRLELVLRRDPPGRTGEGDRGLEARLLRAAEAAGVPVPRVHFACDDPGWLGSPFYLMERVPGETIPRRLLRDERFAGARAALTEQLGAARARLHSIDPGAPELVGLEAAGAGSAREEVLRIAQGIRALAPEPHPVLDLAERWLLARAPEPRRRALVHGDYRIGNVVFDEQGLRAILDWELAHVGDPIEDLGWLCVRAWRFGGDALPVGGIGTREDLLRAYAAAGGDPVAPEALRFWEACGNFKLALVFIRQSRVFLDGLPSIELASLGRRTAEAEAELVEIMQGDRERRA